MKVFASLDLKEYVIANSVTVHTYISHHGHHSHTCMYAINNVEFLTTTYIPTVCEQWIPTRRSKQSDQCNSSSISCITLPLLNTGSPRTLNACKIITILVCLGRTPTGCSNFRFRTLCDPIVMDDLCDWCLYSCGHLRYDIITCKASVR